MSYQPFPLEEMFYRAKKNGIDFKLLIEPFDGFHPSLLGNYMMSEIVWENLVKEYPEAIGPVNPNNEMIERLFRDQGGY